MIIEIDDKSGFCFGVVKAISKAEELIANGGVIYSLGDIVHNRIEVLRLEKAGLVTVAHDKFSELENVTVLVRAHGEPPETYQKAKDQNITIVDATCPVVASLQKMVVTAYQKMKPENGQVVLLGKRGHAEVVGLIGQVEGDVVVVESVEELDNVDYSRPIYFLSQTTQSLDLFNEMAERIRANAQDIEKVTINDTICRQVSGRGPHLKNFAAKFDVVIFVSGSKSSNGKVLYKICKDENPASYKIEEPEELDPKWFENCKSVGICGATSTPKWLMMQVFDKLQAVVNQ